MLYLDLCIKVHFFPKRTKTKIFRAIPKGSIYFFTDPKSASSEVPARKIMTSYDLKHWLARMLEGKIFYFTVRRTITTRKNARKKKIILLCGHS